MDTSLDQLRQLLSSVKLSSLVEQQQDVCTLEHNATIAEALKLLAQRGILSAPLVVNPGLEDLEAVTPGESSAPQLIGWVDVRDIIRAFIAFVHEQHPNQPVYSNMLGLMSELEKQGPPFASKMLITVLGSEDRGLVYQTDAEASVLTAIREVFLGQGNGGRVHRLAIFDASGDITHIVSQLDALRLLVKHRAELGPAADQSLAELGLAEPGERELVLLEPTTPTLLALEKIAAAGITGAPVVSLEGELIANLSLSDIRGIQPSAFGVLALPVAEFLAVRHGTSYLGFAAEHTRAASHAFFAGGPSPRSMRPASEPGAGEPLGAGAAAAAEPPAGDGRGSKGPGTPRASKQHQHQQQQQQQEARPSSPGGNGVPLITCAPEATLFELLSMMTDNNIHRVYVVRKGAKPCEVQAVVTPTDVLSLIAGAGGWLQRQQSIKRQAGAEPAAGDGEALAAAAAAAAAGAAGAEHAKKVKVDAA